MSNFHVVTNQATIDKRRYPTYLKKVAPPVAYSKNDFMEKIIMPKAYQSKPFKRKVIISAEFLSELRDDKSTGQYSIESKSTNKFQNVTSVDSGYGQSTTTTEKQEGSGDRNNPSRCQNCHKKKVM